MARVLRPYFTRMSAFLERQRNSVVSDAGGATWQLQRSSSVISSRLKSSRCADRKRRGYSRSGDPDPDLPAPTLSLLHSLQHRTSLCRAPDSHADARTILLIARLEALCDSRPLSPWKQRSLVNTYLWSSVGRRHSLPCGFPEELWVGLEA